MSKPGAGQAFNTNLFLRCKHTLAKCCAQVVADLPLERLCHCVTPPRAWCRVETGAMAVLSSCWHLAYLFPDCVFVRRMAPSHLCVLQPVSAQWLSICCAQLQHCCCLRMTWFCPCFAGAMAASCYKATKPTVQHTLYFA